MNYCYEKVCSPLQESRLHLASMKECHFCMKRTVGLLSKVMANSPNMGQLALHIWLATILSHANMSKPLETLALTLTLALTISEYKL